MRWIPTSAFLLVLGLFLLGGLPALRAEDPPEEAAGEADEGAGQDLEIVWLDDLDEAREQAAAEGKGVFVYLTPSWFT